MEQRWSEKNGVFNEATGEYTLNKNIDSLESFKDFKYKNFSLADLKMVNLSNFIGEQIPYHCFEKCSEIESVILSSKVKKSESPVFLTVKNLAVLT